MEALRLQSAGLEAGSTSCDLERLKEIICALYGFALNVRGELGISSLAQLVHRDIISGYVEWCINTRRMKIYGLEKNAYLVLAAMEKHPSYTTINFTWFKPLLDSLPIESQSELKKRKASKCLDYDVVDAIPAKIHAERPAAAKKGLKQSAQVVQQETPGQVADHTSLAAKKLAAMQGRWAGTQFVQGEDSAFLRYRQARMGPTGRAEESRCEVLAVSI